MSESQIARAGMPRVEDDGRVMPGPLLESGGWDGQAADSAVVAELQNVWAVTGFDDAVRLTAGLGTSALRMLLDYERENSARPRHRQMLRRRIDGLPFDPT